MYDSGKPQGVGKSAVGFQNRMQNLKKKESHFSAGLFGADKKLEHDDVSGLQTFGTFFDGELHLLAFLKVLEPVTADGGEVDENIGTAFALDETEALGAVEPFNRTDYTIRHFCLLSKIKNKVTQSSFIGRLNKTAQRSCFELPSYYFHNEKPLASYGRNFIMKFSSWQLFYRLQNHHRNQAVCGADLVKLISFVV
jgi:hypothetical protein